MNLSKELEKAASHFQQGKMELAISVCQHILQAYPDSLVACMNLASAFGATGQYENAVKSFRRACDIAPDNPEVFYRLALAYVKTHQIDAAESSLQGTLQRFPEHIAMQVLYASLQRRAGKLEDARQRLQQFSNRQLASHETAALFIELGNVLDKLGHYSLAFESYKKGQKAAGCSASAEQARAIPFLKIITTCQDWLTAEKVAKWTVHEDDKGEVQPIFLVGHPRSGTTLSEHILSGHPQLEPSDENPIIRLMITDISRKFGQSVSYPQYLDKLSVGAIKNLRRQYHEATSRLLSDGKKGSRLVDKHPLNLVDLGFIKRIFPAAKIMVILRDPRDVCLSCFFQNFGMNKSTVHFTDLQNTAAHYATVMSFWLHFRKTLDGQYFEYRYEDLTTDFEATAKNMINFINEPWDDSVLSFYEKSQKRYVSTPSFEGVTSPVYQQSVARWKKYERQLEPILPILQPFIEAFGYD